MPILMKNENGVVFLLFIATLTILRQLEGLFRLSNCSQLHGEILQDSFLNLGLKIAKMAWNGRSSVYPNVK